MKFQLKFEAPDNGISNKCKNVSSSKFNVDRILVVFIVPQYWKVGINVEVNFQASVWMECESVYLISLKALTDVFNFFFKTFSRDVTEPYALMYHKF